jgi:uncharacterized repeat protein (TIGR01451 family)
MKVTKSGPQESHQGEKIYFRVEVVNTGEVPITGLTIVDEYPRSLAAVEASDGFQAQPGKLVWTVDQILPGESVAKLVRCECVEADRSACARVTVSTREGLTMADEACLEIFLPRPPAQPPTAPEIPHTEPATPPGDSRPGGVEEPLEPETPTSGQLRIEVVDLDDPIKRGESTKFSVTIQNDREDSDKNVQLVLELSPGLSFGKIQGGPAVRSSDGRTMKLEPIVELRARETIDFRVGVVAKRAGKQKLTITADSLRSPETITVTEDLTVNVE